MNVTTGIREVKGYPPNGCARGCWRPGTTAERICGGANAPTALVCQPGDCPPQPLCPVCHLLPVRPRRYRAGSAPSTCSVKCTNRAAECRRQGVPVDTPPLRGAALTAARRISGRKRKGARPHPLTDGTVLHATPEAHRHALAALKRADLGMDQAVELAQVHGVEARAAAVRHALDGWFMRGYIRGRAERARVT
jgi:hypothetical protein